MTYHLSGFRYERVLGINTGRNDAWLRRPRPRLARWEVPRLGKSRPWKQRRAWIHREESATIGPYQQLATVYRNAGLDREARHILVAGNRRTARGPRRLLEIIGYGYRPSRAGLIALAFLLVGWGIVHAADQRALLIPAKPDADAACPQHYPCLEPLVYVGETLVPLVDLDQREHYRPDTTRPWGWWLRNYLWATTLIGWALTTLIVAGFTGIVRHQR